MKTTQKNNHALTASLIILLTALFPAHSPPPAHCAVQAPTLKWSYGGCYSSWCETGWYSSPAVADLDGDGTTEIIAAAYSIVALSGATGELQWRVASGHDRSEPDADYVGRTWPGVVITDTDNDGVKEIVTAHSGGYVATYNANGYFETGWPQQPTSKELRGLRVADVDNDGNREILVTGAVSDQVNAWLYEDNGSLRGGWPQLADDSGYSYGVFNDNSWISDINGDGYQEIIVPSDVHYICAYSQDGAQLPANSTYGDKGWGKVGVWEDLSVEERGWGDCSSSRAERYRTNFAHGAAVAADVDGDGQQEVIVTGNMYDCAVGHPPGKYNALFIFNADRSRFQTDTYDWRTIPVDTGAPLSEDYDLIENCQSNPVVVDLDGDGEKEILYPSYDGRLHAFWLDKTEHHSWPYSVYNSAEGFFRFASEPVVADLDNDGKAEVLFASWVEKLSSGGPRLGKFHILDYQGNLLHEIDLPTPRSSSSTWNGGLAAPTLADIDGDGELEAVVNTVASGFVAYDLPGTTGARVLWRTGRNNQYDEYVSGGGSNRSSIPAVNLLLLKAAP